MARNKACPTKGKTCNRCGARYHFEATTDQETSADGSPDQDRSEDSAEYVCSEDSTEYVCSEDSSKGKTCNRCGARYHFEATTDQETSADGSPDQDRSEDSAEYVFSEDSSKGKTCKRYGARYHFEAQQIKKRRLMEVQIKTAPRILLSMFAPKILLSMFALRILLSMFAPRILQKENHAPDVEPDIILRQRQIKKRRLMEVQIKTAPRILLSMFAPRILMSMFAPKILLSMFAPRILLSMFAPRILQKEKHATDVEPDIILRQRQIKKRRLMEVQIKTALRILLSMFAPRILQKEKDATDVKPDIILRQRQIKKRWLMEFQIKTAPKILLSMFAPRILLSMFAPRILLSMFAPKIPIANIPSIMSVSRPIRDTPFPSRTRNSHVDLYLPASSSASKIPMMGNGLSCLYA